MTELKHNMREKEFQQAVDEGLIVQTSMNPELLTYHIKGAGIRWNEFQSRKDIELLVAEGWGGIATRLAHMQENNNWKARRYALLKHQYTQLRRLALDEKLITRNGTPCANCKSTNTQTDWDTHYVESGHAHTWGKHCYDCNHSEVGGDRI
jgi:hypothetical protein